MKIPTLRCAKEFIDGLSVPCLVATVKNSMLPNVARRHIAKYKKDPTCKIYLRSAIPKEISKRQMVILRHLFAEEKLPAVIEEGMKEYEKDPWPGYDQTDEDDYRDIKRHGIVPHLTLSVIIIDDIKHEAIIDASTEWDGNLHEHGINIYLKEGRWRFDYDSYIVHYSNSIYTKERERRLWEICVPTPPGTKAATDADFLYGIWIFEEKEAVPVYKRLRLSRTEIRDALRLFQGMQITISRGVFQESFSDGFSPDYILEGCERHGNKVTFSLRDPRTGHGASSVYCYLDGLLIDIDGRVMKKKG